MFANNYACPFLVWYDLSDLGVPQGTSVNRLILNSPVSGDWAGIGAIKHPGELEIVVQTFIPIQDPANPKTIGSPYGWFATDLRTGIDATKGVADNDYRTRLHVKIDTVNSTLISATSDAGDTKEYADKEGTIIIGQAEVQEGEDMFHKAKVSTWFDDSFISLRGQATDPLLTIYHQLMNGASDDSYLETLGDLATAFPWVAFAPGVNFDLHMTFDPDEEQLRVFGSSKHDGFPSYEIFVRYDGGPWQTLYFWDSKMQASSPFEMFGDGTYEHNVTEFTFDLSS